jgi:hypothetical protein
MSRILARLKSVNSEDVNLILKKDEELNSKKGLYRNHSLKNEEDLCKALFLFQINTINPITKKMINKKEK